MANDYELQNVTTWRLRELRQHETDNHALRVTNAELRTALRDLLDVIAADDLVPESVSYMQQARAAIAKAEGRG